MRTIEKHRKIPASFRDPSGFVFAREGLIYRQVNRSYQDQYHRLMSSGLYDGLVRAGLLVPHTEVGSEQAVNKDAYKVVRPAQIPFISYPYEWCFSQLKHAALLTLEVQLKALDFEMSLKDCSAYNVQFKDGKPIFIDTLSFAPYREGQPWVAYRQFCQHFLAPLALMSQTDIRLEQLLRIYIDGIPLDLTSALLPARSWVNFALLSHIHLHAKSQKRFAGKAISTKQGSVSRTAFLGLLDNLRTVVEKLEWQPEGTEWHNYYATSNYSPTALAHKKRLVAEMLDRIEPAPKMVWDLGANVGLFSRIAGDRGILTISFDMDPAAVEQNYLQSVAQTETRLLPLVLDLTNPSPGLGWETRERMSLLNRCPADAVFALALLHHLVIGNNLPFEKVAHFFQSICKRALVIEFVPKQDAQVQKLLLNREDIFGDYNPQTFEAEFGRFFIIEAKNNIQDTDRTLYLMTKRAD